MQVVDEDEEEEVDSDDAYYENRTFERKECSIILEDYSYEEEEDTPAKPDVSWEVNPNQVSSVQSMYHLGGAGSGKVAKYRGRFTWRSTKITRIFLSYIFGEKTWIFRSRSVVTRSGSADLDPDPDQNETDPKQYWVQITQFDKFNILEHKYWLIHWLIV